MIFWLNFTINKFIIYSIKTRLHFALNEGVDFLDKQLAKKMSGAYALMRTPLKEDGTIDYSVYEKYAEWQSTQCEHLFAVCGSSEMRILSPDERVKLAGLTVKNSNGSFVVATGNMADTLEEEKEEIKRLEAAGVDGLVLVTKNTGNDPDLCVEYLTSLARTTKLPCMLYEFPGYDYHNISGELYGRLVETGMFYGIKDTTCTMADIKEKIAVQGDSNVLQANVPLLLEAWKAGARGVMATPLTCASHLFQKMWDEFSSGDLDAAKNTFDLVNILDGCIDSGFNLSAKYLVKLQGFDFMPIGRNGRCLNEQRLHALDVFYAWGKEHGIFTR